MRIGCELHVFHLKSPQAAPIIDGSMERLEGAARGSEITDLAADVANDPAEPGAQDAQLPLMQLELFGMGVPARHHRGGLGHTRIGLPQRGPVPPRQAIEPLDRRVPQLGIGRKGDGLRLHSGEDRDPLRS